MSKAHPSRVVSAEKRRPLDLLSPGFRALKFIIGIGIRVVVQIMVPFWVP